ncbi:MAG TPA: Ig-like domain-containing protein, partial [Candidatus Saccharimonadales bacterium]|nr:Ig-like domain-containing protein [Candidatus Saccharimonadales bacterium]
MKAIFSRRCLLAAVLAAGLGIDGVAAPHRPFFPIITVQATAPLASEPGNNPAVFTVSRAGDTNAAVTISYQLRGTAGNGVDYAATPTSVTLAAGQTSAAIVITPVEEPSAKRYKTVILSLPWSFDFRIGSLDRAVAYIAYNYTNVPPTIKWATPTNGSSFLSLPNIELVASAFDSNGWVASVEFFANATSVGVVNDNRFESWPAYRHSDRYQFVWTNVPPGSYALTATATDNAGLQTTTPPATITVSTNLPVPEVRMVNPVDGAEFSDRPRLNLYAAAGEVGGVVDTVELFANGDSLGVATNYL